MICVPCFIAPVILFIWYKFIYPLVRPILERYFGDRFAEPKDGSCPVCPIGSKGKCELQKPSDHPDSTSTEPITTKQQEGDKKED